MSVLCVLCVADISQTKHKTRHTCLLSPPPCLLPQVHFIFGRVASLYCDTLAATLDVLKPPTLEAVQQAQQAQQGQQQAGAPAALGVDVAVWEECRKLNTQYALQVGEQCIAGLHTVRNLQNNHGVHCRMALHPTNKHCIL